MGLLQDSEMIIGNVFVHSKSGNRYQFMGFTRSSKTCKLTVRYKALYHHPEFGDLVEWDRPFKGEDGFMELVSLGGKMVPRYVREGGG